MELYIYSPSALLGVVDSTSSVRWRRKYFEPGEVEIHLPATAENLELCAIGHVIRRIGCDETAIIEGQAVDGDDLTLTGRMLSSVLDRSIISKTYNFSGTYEAAMLTLISEASRASPQVTAGTAQGFTDAMSAQITWKNLLTVEEKLSLASTIGFKMLFEPGAWKFQTYKGTDRSIGQSVNPFVFFSDEFGNLTLPKYTRDVTALKNFAYVAGEGEGSDRTIVTVDQTGGGERRELYVNASDASSTATAEDDFTGDGTTVAFILSRTPTNISSITVGGTATSDYTLSGNTVTFTAAPASGASVVILSDYTMTTEEYAAVLRQRGIEALAACPESESFEADGEDIANFAYRQDWDLGDIVTVQYTKLGLSTNQRITEVEEVYENGTATVTPTFGTPLPETLDLGDD